MRKFLSATAAAALVIGTITPAYASDFASQPMFDAPQGATATLNLKVPLGASQAKAKKASYGLTLGYGQAVGAPGTERGFTVRQAKLADIRFTDAFMLQKAEVVSFDLANLDQDRRMKMAGEDATLWIVGGVVVAGVVVCLLADCFD